MIEVKVTEDGKPITPDGSFDSDRARAVAAGLDEVCRLLNYATMPGSGGLTWPADAYSMLGELQSATARLPQAFGQIVTFLDTLVAQDAVRENPAYGDHGGDTARAVAVLRVATQAAKQAAHVLSDHLRVAQAATRGLESPQSDED
jgi:hypothetical protein